MLQAYMLGSLWVQRGHKLFEFNKLARKARLRLNLYSQNFFNLGHIPP